MDSASVIAIRGARPVALGAALSISGELLRSLSRAVHSLRTLRRLWVVPLVAKFVAVQLRFRVAAIPILLRAHSLATVRRVVQVTQPAEPSFTTLAVWG